MWVYMFIYFRMVCNVLCGWSDIGWRISGSWSLSVISNSEEGCCNCKFMRIISVSIYLYKEYWVFFLVRI